MSDTALVPNTPPTLIPFFTIQLEPYGLVIAKHFHRHEVAKAHSPGQSEAAPRVSNATSNPQPCNPLIRWALLFRFDRFCSSLIEIFSPRHISSYIFIVPCYTWAQTCIGNREMAVNVGMGCCINKYFAKNKRHFTKKNTYTCVGIRKNILILHRQLHCMQKLTSIGMLLLT